MVSTLNSMLQHNVADRFFIHYFVESVFVVQTENTELHGPIGIANPSWRDLRRDQHHQVLVDHRLVDLHDPGETVPHTRIVQVAVLELGLFGLLFAFRLGWS